MYSFHSILNSGNCKQNLNNPGEYQWTNTRCTVNRRKNMQMRSSGNILRVWRWRNWKWKRYTWVGLFRVHTVWLLTLFSYDTSSEICCLSSFRATLLGSLTSRYLIRCFIASIRDTDSSFSLIILLYLSEKMYSLINKCFLLHLS